MKNFSRIMVVLLFSIALTFTAYAKVGDIVGEIYSTDIKAEINGTLVDSYNIGGQTAVVLEDLTKIGAEVSYNDSLRTLIVNTVTVSCKESDVREDSAQPGQQIGVPVGNIYESDIVTYLNGEQIRTYSLDGKMAAVMEEIGLAGEHGWSKYNAVCRWYADERKVELEFLTSSFYASGDMEMRESLGELLDSKHARLVCHNDRVYLEKSILPAGMSMVMTNDGEIYLEYGMPVSIVMEKGKSDVVVGRMFKSKNVHFLMHDDGSVTIENDGETIELYYDFEEIYEVVKQSIPFTFTKQEVVDYFTGASFYAIVHAKLDIAECTFLYLGQGTPHGATYSLVRVANDGTYTMYDKAFTSVSLWGTKSFDEVTVNLEGKYVTFGYDKWYKIDLVTGEMTSLEEKP